MLQGLNFDHIKSSIQQAFEAPMQTVWVDSQPNPKQKLVDSFQKRC